MASELKFADGEIVLCLYGPLIYKAQCIIGSTNKTKVRYLIHYTGFHEKWDEWVPESRLLKHNAANVQRQKEARRAHAARPKKPKRKVRSKKAHIHPAIRSCSVKLQNLAVDVQSKKADIQPAIRSCSVKLQNLAVEVQSKKADIYPAIRPCSVKLQNLAFAPAKGRQSEAAASATLTREACEGVKLAGMALEAAPVPAELHQEVQDTPAADPGSEQNHSDASSASSDPEYKVIVPYVLTEWLVDDWALITKRKKLVKLPAKLTVSQILSNYLYLIRSSGSCSEVRTANLQNITEAIKDLFDETLGTQFLYLSERAQYNETVYDYPGTPMSNMYGGIHLLRFLSEILKMIVTSDHSERLLKYLVEYVNDFLKYLETHRATFFSFFDYENAT